MPEIRSVKEPTAKDRTSLIDKSEYSDDVDTDNEIR